MTAPGRGPAALEPELARRVGAVARALVAAGRSRALYPADHPAVRTSLDRLAGALPEASGGQALVFRHEVVEAIDPERADIDPLAHL